MPGFGPPARRPPRQAPSSAHLTAAGRKLAVIYNGDEGVHHGRGRKVAPAPYNPPMRRIMLALLVIVLAYFAVTTFLVATWMGKDERRPADAIVVLGAAQYDGRPSAIYRARLEHAVDLYNQRLAPVIVFTGGNTPGDRFTEGASGARWAVRQGVPTVAALVEDHSRSTYQNLAGAKRTLADRRSANRRLRVVLVSDPFHMYRAVRQARDLGLEAYPSPTRTSPLSASKVKLTESVIREDLAIAGYVLARRG
jgi:uncharacterized SAM-binding protein YcdF (DUF218 family)